MLAGVSEALAQILAPTDCQTLSQAEAPRVGEPTRLPRPWDSPGKNTGISCHFLLQCIKGKSESEVAQSCLTLLDPMVCSLPGSSVHGIFQARVLEWGAIAFSICILTLLFTPSLLNPVYSIDDSIQAFFINSIFDF